MAGVQGSGSWKPSAQQADEIAKRLFEMGKAAGRRDAAAGKTPHTVEPEISDNAWRVHASAMNTVQLQQSLGVLQQAAAGLAAGMQQLMGSAGAAQASAAAATPAPATAAPTAITTPAPKPKPKVPNGYNSLKAARRGQLLYRGQRNDRVKALKRALNRAGAKPPLRLTKRFDKATRRAVRRLQRQHGLRADGVVDHHTMGALDKALGLKPLSGKLAVKAGRKKVRKAPPFYNQAFRKLRGKQRIKQGASGARVKVLQRALNMAGYRPPLEITGRFGPRVTKAVKKLQRRYRLPQTGIVGADTLGALDKSLGMKPRSGVLKTGRTGGGSHVGGAGNAGPAGPVTGNMSKVLKFKPAIMAAAKKHKVPPELIAAIADAESGGNPRARSFDGGHGKGLMQIDDRFHDIARSDRIFDPKVNTDYGAKLIASNLKRFPGNIRAAIAAYNAGQGGVASAIAAGRDPSTATYDPNYISKIQGLMKKYASHF